jgi:hypothetical protein
MTKHPIRMTWDGKKASFMFPDGEVVESTFYQLMKHKFKAKIISIELPEDGDIGRVNYEREEENKKIISAWKSDCNAKCR